MRRADAAGGMQPSRLGRFECSPLSVASVTTAARQIVSKRWWEGGGLKHLHVTERSAFRLYQKMANFKAAMESRAMQWSAMPEEKHKNQLAQTQFRFIKTIIRAEAFTPRLSHSHQRCTAAKYGKLQGTHT